MSDFSQTKVRQFNQINLKERKHMNKVILMGRLTKDPEVKATASVTIVAKFTLAVNKRTKKDHPEADFIQIVSFNKTAEFVKNYFFKGQQVAVVGRISTRSWDDTEGKKRYATEVIADEVFFADSKKSDSPARTEQPSAYEQPSQIKEGDVDDDLPF